MTAAVARRKPAADTPGEFDELTAAESAAYLGCSRATFYRNVSGGWIPASHQTFAGPRWHRFELDDARRERAARGKRAKARART